MSNTIQEDYVSFETAKLLKRGEFNSMCNVFYDKDGKKHNSYCSNFMSTMEKRFACPTQALAIKWLRIEHNIYIENDVTLDKNGDWFFCKVIDKKRSNYKFIEGSFKPEEVVERSIQYCLKHLI